MNIKINKYFSIISLMIFIIIITMQYCSIRNKNYTLLLSQKIYTILDKYRITYDIDLHGVNPDADTTPQSVQGIDQCIQNIAYFVNQNRPLNMLLVGFPFKSGNQEKKVLGTLPDMAERKSLEYLQEMLTAIKTVYAPGAKILIFCDGIPFAEFFGISFDNVLAYEEELKQLSKDLPDVTIVTSKNIMQKHQLKSVSEIIQIIDQYEPNDKQFRDELKKIPEVALKRFALELDHPKGRMLIKKNTLQEIAIRLLAREMRLRRYITENFPSPNFFRLTVHLSTDVSKKFGIRLSPTSDITLYHGIMVQNDDTWSICFKKDIDKDQYIYDNNIINGSKYGYYKKIVPKK